MRTVAVVEAKSQFSALLAAVESGEEVAITRRGRVVARLVPDTARSAADVFRPCWREGGSIWPIRPIRHLSRLQVGIDGAMHYLLDTNVFIAALKAHPAVRTRLESVPASSILVSPIVLGELETGVEVEKSAQVERNRTRLNEVVGGLRFPPSMPRRVRITHGFARDSSGKARRSVATICGSQRRRLHSVPYW